MQTHVSFVCMHPLAVSLQRTETTITQSWLEIITQAIMQSLTES